MARRSVKKQRFVECKLCGTVLVESQGGKGTFVRILRHFKNDCPVTTKRSRNPHRRGKTGFRVTKGTIDWAEFILSEFQEMAIDGVKIMNRTYGVKSLDDVGTQKFLDAAGHLKIMFSSWLGPNWKLIDAPTNLDKFSVIVIVYMTVLANMGK